MKSLLPSYEILRPYIANAVHILLTGFVALLVALLQNWLTTRGTPAHNIVNPEATGTLGMALAGFKRIKFS